MADMLNCSDASGGPVANEMISDDSLVYNRRQTTAWTRLG